MVTEGSGACPTSPAGTEWSDYTAVSELLNHVRAQTNAYEGTHLPTPRELVASVGLVADREGWRLIAFTPPDEPAGSVTWCKAVAGRITQLTASPFGESDGSHRILVGIYIPLPRVDRCAPAVPMPRAA